MTDVSMHDHDHHNDHHHHHGHAHAHGPANYDLAFAVGVALNIGFVAAESFYGVAAHSLALLADAGHNVSDVLGLLLAWAASWATKRRPTARWTYGFGRGSILASLINAAVLLMVVGGIAWEAILRLTAPEAIAESTVAWVAALGIAVNGGTALMFLRGSREDINIRGAFLHMAGDAGVSLGVVVAALAMRQTGWLWLDPAASLVIVVVIALGTLGLLRESLGLALDAVPARIDHEGVERFLCALPGVAGIHDLHIWPLSTTSVALTAHLVNPAGDIGDDGLHRIAGELHERFGIDHTTLQVERGGGDTLCRLATHVG
ncbi:MAG: cation diffusion facilitator family transporter [Magnetospirillum sp.]|nr:cation diffusion facilitator family transporter [Magnetospirillum sp.]